MVSNAALKSKDTRSVGLPWSAEVYTLSRVCNSVVSVVYSGFTLTLGTRIRVPVNTCLHVFERWSFTLTQVLYEYELPVNFTRTGSFLAGRDFIQPVRCKQHKICINLIYTRHDAYFTS